MKRKVFWQSFSNINLYTKQIREWEDKLKKFQEEIKTDAFKKMSVDYKEDNFILMINIAKHIEETKKTLKKSQLNLEKCLKSK